MLNLITSATPTAKFTGSPIPLRTSHLVWSRNSQALSAWRVLGWAKRGGQNKPPAFCLRRNTTAPPQFYMPTEGLEGRLERGFTLGGELGFFCFSDSNPRLTYLDPCGTCGERDGSTWNFFLPAGSRPNHLIMWIFKRKESRVPFRFFLPGGYFTSASLPTPSLRRVEGWKRDLLTLGLKNFQAYE